MFCLHGMWDKHAAYAAQNKEAGSGYGCKVIATLLWRISRRRNPARASSGEAAEENHGGNGIKGGKERQKTAFSRSLEIGGARTRGALALVC